MKKLCIMAFVLLAATGCQQVNRTFGLERNTPDEYDTLNLPPLSLPPHYDVLPQPEEEPRSRAREKAKEVLLKESATKQKATKGEKALLSQAGTEKNDPEVRKKLRAQNNQNVSSGEDGIELLKDDILDAEAEKKRLEELEKRIEEKEKKDEAKN